MGHFISSTIGLALYVGGLIGLFYIAQQSGLIPALVCAGAYVAGSIIISLVNDANAVTAARRKMEIETK